ncbi:AraC family transcriptional regulator [Vallitalea guaymasensis]|uniref:Helix-turn-helix transcriptional regulator n=1 Tax=Vallitalea guaymasensis TaxID=1185412 RepID=A0A8J8MDU6_9FIRM|nr:AraC family transcriptional regulator [Vallitalea guaymasensis]QUH31229.1 helix-turn-helix transcriptional regulator [Vallitalea guaymasensis]
MHDHLLLKDFLKDDEKYYVAKSLFSSNIKSNLHSHDFYEMFFVEKGTFIHYIDDEKHYLPVQSIQFIYPDDTHCFSAKKDKETTITNLAFYFSELDDKCKSFFNRIRQENSNSGIPSVYALDYQWNSIFSKLGKIKQMPTEVQEYYFQSIIYDYIFIYNTNKLSAMNNEIIPGWLQSAKEEMKKQDNFVIGLKRFIEISEKSHEHLSRQMKKYYNQTPAQWINQLRLEKMEILLLTTKMDILDIVYEVGFHNVSYCYSLFKKKNLLPPKEFREGNRRIFNA